MPLFFMAIEINGVPLAQDWTADQGLQADSLQPLAELSDKDGCISAVVVEQGAGFPAPAKTTKAAAK
jgi:hypothetical protein